MVDCYHSLLRMKPNAVFLELFINSCCRIRVDAYVHNPVCKVCMHICVEKMTLIGFLNKDGDSLGKGEGHSLPRMSQGMREV